MLNSIPFKKLVFYSMIIAILVANQSGFAETRLQIPIILEGIEVYNNEVIENGCHVSFGNVIGGGKNILNTPVLGTSVVFPDAEMDPENWTVA
jgi:hypothetical protein